MPLTWVRQALGDWKFERRLLLGSPREQLYFSRTITQVYRYCIPRVERRMYFGLGYHTTLAAANVLIMYQVFACVYDVAFPRNDEASVGPVRQAEAGCF